MKTAVIVDCCRTPIGRAHAEKGVFRDVRSDDLAVAVVQRARRAHRHRSGARSKTSCWATRSSKASRVSTSPASSALMAGLPVEAGGATVNRLCGSSLQALDQAAHSIIAGAEDVQIVGGLEHMHHIPMDAGIDLNPKLFTRTSKARWTWASPPSSSRRRKASRAKSKTQFALRSHQKARRGTDGRRVRARDRSQSGAATKPATASSSTAISASAPMPAWKRSPRCKPAFMPGIGTVTAGNSSPLNDGAAALLDHVRRKGRSRSASSRWRKVRATAVVGVDPSVMGTGPVPATQKALKRAGLKLADIDLIELNEAFAAQALACIRMLELDEEKVNVRGGAIAIGHPLGASGARIATTLHPRHARPRRHARPGHDVHRRRPGNRRDLRAGLARRLPSGVPGRPLKWPDFS